MQRVVFENGHCLLPRQENMVDYMCILDDEVRKIAGKLVSVCDTGICITEAPSDTNETSESIGDITLSMENICGCFRGLFENEPSAGSLLLHGAPRVGIHVQHRQFIGTHRLFHSVHGRFAYREKKKIWTFKGGRSLEDIVGFVRDITDDRESPIYPTVNMLSVTMRTNTTLVINPADSLMQRVLERLYSRVVRIQSRVDDANNLFFMDVVGWDQLLKVVKKDVEDPDVDEVRAYMALHSDNPLLFPTTSIGYTRKGIFFIRITFPRGCVCNVTGSRGSVDGVLTPVPKNVCVGGVEPFVNVVVRFIVVVLVKMRVVGVF